MNVHEMLAAINGERARVPAADALRMTPAVRRDIIHLARWTRERKLDPMLWIRSQFAARGYRVSPRVRAMASDRSMARYEEFGADLAAASIEQDALRATTLPAAALDASPLAELARRRLRGSPALCMAQTASLTRGWSPASPTCGPCPRASACRDALPLSLQARRDGVARRIGIRA